MTITRPGDQAADLKVEFHKHSGPFPHCSWMGKSNFLNVAVKSWFGFWPPSTGNKLKPALTPTGKFIYPATQAGYDQILDNIKSFLSQNIKSRRGS